MLKYLLSRGCKRPTWLGRFLKGPERNREEGNDAADDLEGSVRLSPTRFCSSQMVPGAFLPLAGWMSPGR